MLSSVRAGPPTPFDVVRDHEVLAVLAMPALYFAVLLGWRALPLAALAAAAWLMWGHLLAPLAPYAAAALVASAVALAVAAKAKGLGTFRRRMRVYGVAVAVLCDYRILRVRCRGLDAEEANFLWERAHRRWVGWGGVGWGGGGGGMVGGGVGGGG
jgi:hypothetical protein